MQLSNDVLHPELLIWIIQVDCQKSGILDNPGLKTKSYGLDLTCSVNRPEVRLPNLKILSLCLEATMETVVSFEVVFMMCKNKYNSVQWSSNQQGGKWGLFTICFLGNWSVSALQIYMYTKKRSLSELNSDNKSAYRHAQNLEACSLWWHKASTQNVQCRYPKSAIGHFRVSEDIVREIVNHNLHQHEKFMSTIFTVEGIETLDLAIPQTPNNHLPQLTTHRSSQLK